MQAHAQFDIESWDESPFDSRSDVPKITRAVVAKQYAGDIEGSSTTEWLLAYAEDGSAEFVGLERISGSVCGRGGSLALRHVGSYEDGEARGALEVVDGASSGELKDATGSGRFRADPSGSVMLDLTLD